MKDKAISSLKGNTLLKADLRRLFTTSRLWIFLLVCLVTPILILTMTTGFGGDMSFNSTWDLIASSGGMGMDMTASIVF